MPVLDGYRVLDLSIAMSGPLAAMRLGDLGADVIKIEPPAGEWQRHAPAGGATGNQVNASFLALNRNKRSLAVDLKDDRGRALLHELVAGADVFPQNYRPGVAERLGVDYPAISAIKPGIVHVSMSGYGETGPYARRPGQDLLLQAMGGPCTARARPGRRRRRRRTSWSTRSPRTRRSRGCSRRRGREIHAHCYIRAPCGIFPTADGYLSLAFADLAVLADVLQVPELARWHADRDGFTHRDEISALVTERVRTQPTDQTHNGSFVTYDHPTEGTVTTPGFAFTMSATPPAVSWDRQSLADFEARPVAEPARQYDVLIIDHPGLGAAIAAGAIQPLRRLVPREVMAEWKATSFVPTWDSYVVGGQPWALPVDAATQVSVYRPDLMTAAPRGWAEVPALARERRVALCLGGPHAFLAVLAMCAPGGSLRSDRPGTVLGGTGLAVSARSEPDPGEVAAFLTAFWTAEVQAGLVPAHAGQSARVAAWDSPRVDRDWGGRHGLGGRGDQRRLPDAEGQDPVTVSYEAGDGVAVLTLDRPDKLNAVTTAMSERLFGLIAEIGTNDEVRAVVLTGDPVDAAEARRIGLVSRVYSPDELVPTARSLASVIASRPPVAAQAAKANLLAARSMGLEQAIQYEREMQAICMGTRDAAEGRSAFAEKRVPRFIGR